jgi:hypothetical protein
MIMKIMMKITKHVNVARNSHAFIIVQQKFGSNCGAINSSTLGCLASCSFHTDVLQTQPDVKCEVKD